MEEKTIRTVLDVIIIIIFLATTIYYALNINQADEIKAQFYSIDYAYIIDAAGYSKGNMIIKPPYSDETDFLYYLYNKTNIVSFIKVGWIPVSYMANTNWLSTGVNGSAEFFENKENTMSKKTEEIFFVKDGSNLIFGESSLIPKKQRCPELREDKDIIITPIKYRAFQEKRIALSDDEENQRNKYNTDYGIYVDVFDADSEETEADSEEFTEVNEKNKDLYGKIKDKRGLTKTTNVQFYPDPKNLVSVSSFENKIIVFVGYDYKRSDMDDIIFFYPHDNNNSNSVSCRVSNYIENSTIVPFDVSINSMAEMIEQFYGEENKISIEGLEEDKIISSSIGMIVRSEDEISGTKISDIALGISKNEKDE